MYTGNLRFRGKRTSFPARSQNKPRGRPLPSAHLQSTIPVRRLSKSLKVKSTNVLEPARASPWARGESKWWAKGSGAPGPPSSPSLLVRHIDCALGSSSRDIIAKGTRVPDAAARFINGHTGGQEGTAHSHSMETEARKAEGGDQRAGPWPGRRAPRLLCPEHGGLFPSPPSSFLAFLSSSTLWNHMHRPPF